ASSMSKSLVSSSTRTPGWRRTYGTTINRRLKRSDDLLARRADEAGSATSHRLEPSHYLVLDRLRGVDASVRAEGQDPGHERVGLAGRHVHLQPAVAAGPKDPGSGDVGDRPPGDLGTEGHPGSLRRPPQAPRPCFQLPGGVEPFGPRRPPSP